MASAIKNLVQKIIPRTNLWALQSVVKYNWYIYPVNQYSKIPIKGSHGLNDATNIVDEILKWYALNPRYNYGYNLDLSGLSVIDVDMHGTDGYSALDRMIDMKLVSLDQLNNSLIQLTPSGGMHFIFRTSKRFKKCNIGILNKDFAGIDLLNLGSSVMCAGSTVNYKYYNIANRVLKLDEIEYFPIKLVEYLETLRSNRSVSVIRTGDIKLVDLEVPSYIEGTGRNNWLASCAGRAIGCREIETENDLCNYLLMLNSTLRNRLSGYEVKNISRSIFRYKCKN